MKGFQVSLFQCVLSSTSLTFFLRNYFSFGNCPASNGFARMAPRRAQIYDTTRDELENALHTFFAPKFLGMLFSETAKICHYTEHK